MFSVEIYTEYLRNKHKDKSIRVVKEELSNTTDSTFVYYDNDELSDNKKTHYINFTEIKYKDLWITIRTLKLKKLKKKIYVNKF